MVKHVKYNKTTKKLYIQNKNELKGKVDSKHYNELESTVNRMNDVINTSQGAKLKKQALKELNSNSTQKAISGCGAASLAGFAHTTAFTGLMTVAGISGPEGWAIGAGVGAVWLAGQAAAGCL
ncbi:hypothetical protein ABEY61_29415 [Bacillus toyonensis]|uniref:hypothetical protein n=1 Tax=Bacillus toyonensis TaxID=155322 RepID=UPI003D1E6FE6